MTIFDNIIPAIIDYNNLKNLQKVRLLNKLFAAKQTDPKLRFTQDLDWIIRLNITRLLISGQSSECSDCRFISLE